MNSEIGVAGWFCEVCGAPANTSRNSNPYYSEPHRRCDQHPFSDTLKEAAEKDYKRGLN